MKQGIERYFSFPERSNLRNQVSKEISRILLPAYPHWTTQNVRKFFNNNRNYYLNTPIEEILKSTSFRQESDCPENEKAEIEKIEGHNCQTPIPVISNGQQDLENTNASYCNSNNPPRMHSIGIQAFSETSNEKVALMNKTKQSIKQKNLHINSILNENRLKKKPM